MASQLVDPMAGHNHSAVLACNPTCQAYPPHLYYVGPPRESSDLPPEKAAAPAKTDIPDKRPLIIHFMDGVDRVIEFTVTYDPSGAYSWHWRPERGVLVVQGWRGPYGGRPREEFPIANIRSIEIGGEVSAP